MEIQQETSIAGFQQFQGAKKIVEIADEDEQKEVERQRQLRQDGSLSNHRAKILQQLRTFNAYDGFEVTNCSFVKSKVEICYILKDSESIDKEILKKALSTHLGIQPGDLKLMELRSRPVYKQTSTQPGDRVCLSGQHQSQSSIGAFVKVPGKGIHALMSGHDKTPGATFFHLNGNELGIVEVSLNPLPSISTNEDTVFRDIALGRFYNQREPLNSTVTTGDGVVLRLEEDPREAADKTPVRLFTNGDRKGTINSAWTMDSRLNIEHRLISVQNSEGQAVHDEGESGILIASEPAGIHANGAIASYSVTAVGMLVGTETREYVDPDRIEVVSLAAPLESGFDALRGDPYCNGEVKFC